jgi:hypothetical protein
MPLVKGWLSRVVLESAAVKDSIGPPEKVPVVEKRREKALTPLALPLL